MSRRADRLLALVQLLRRHRRAVSASVLADELGVSARTVYRDIETLRGSGVDIAGEAGIGFLLRDHAFLAPLALSRAEADALALGLRFVTIRGDEALRAAAADVMAKIGAVVRPDIAASMELPSCVVGPMESGVDQQMLARLRHAIEAERKLLIDYEDLSGQRTTRTVWPVLLGFMQGTDMLAAWCELRQAMRHFRVDRIASAEVLEQTYDVRRAVLLSGLAHIG